MNLIVGSLRTFSNNLSITLDLVFSCAICVRCLDATVGVLSDTRTIWIKYVFLSTGILNCFDSVLLNSLNGAICKDGLLLSISKYALNRAIWEYYLFCTVRVVLLNLGVRELEDLQAVGVGRLRRLCLSKVVNNLLVRIRLLDVIIVEINNSVAIGEGFSADAIAENDLLLAIDVCPLHLTVVANDLVLHLRVRLLLVVVMMRELHLVVLFLVVKVLLVTVSWQVRCYLIIIILLLIRLVDFGQVSQRVISSILMTILWIITTRDHVGAGVIFLILDLLLLILELFNTGLSRLCTLSTLLTYASIRIRVTCVTILPLYTARVARATPVEHTLSNASELLLILALVWIRVTTHLIIIVDLTLELLFS